MSIYISEAQLAVQQAFKRMRQRLGLTQKQFASRLGKPQSFVSKLENGQRELKVNELLWILHWSDSTPEDFLKDVHACLKENENDAKAAPVD